MLSLLTAIGTIATEWFSNRAKIKTAEVEAKIEQIKTEGIAAKSADDIALQNMEKSWKDELILVVFLAPLIASFIPQYQEIIEHGFLVIDGMPDWYKLVVVGMISTIMGLRWLIQPVSNIITKRRS